MSLSSKDIIPLKEMRARLTELAEDACAGREKIITRNGKAYVALIDAAARGWDDVEAGDLLSVAELRERYDRGASVRGL